MQVKLHGPRGATDQGATLRAALASYTVAPDLTRDPAERVALWCRRGGAYLLLDAPQLALPDYDEALAVGPEDPWTRVGRAEAHARSGFPVCVRADLGALDRLPRDAVDRVRPLAARVHACLILRSEEASERDPSLDAVRHHLTEYDRSLRPEARGGAWETIVCRDSYLQALFARYPGQRKTVEQLFSTAR